MKIKQLFTYCLVASTFLLASCDNETFAGRGQGRNSFARKRVSIGDFLRIYECGE